MTEPGWDNHCAEPAAARLKAETGSDLWRELGGCPRSWRAAAAAYRTLGVTNLKDAVTAVLGPPVDPRLARRGTPYAAALGALLALAGKPDREALSELEAKAPDDDPAKMDEEWEEKAVTFTAAHDMGGPTGIVAKIRSAARAKIAPRSSQ